jgi:hypothetical protein
MKEVNGNWEKLKELRTAKKELRLELEAVCNELDNRTTVSNVPFLEQKSGMVIPLETFKLGGAYSKYKEDYLHFGRRKSTSEEV